MTQVFPPSIESPIQAMHLVRKANKEKRKFHVYKERALRKLERAIAKVDRADRRLHQTEICRGRLFDIIQASGFQIPTTIPPLPQPLIYVSPDSSM